MMKFGFGAACAAAAAIAYSTAASAQGFERKSFNYSEFAKPIFAEAVTIQSSGPTKWIFLAGIGAENNDGSVAHHGDFLKQCLMSWDKIKKALADHGATVADIVSNTTYVLDMRDRAHLGPCNGQALGDAKPPSTLVGISQLARPGMLIEITVTAVIAGGR